MSKNTAVAVKSAPFTATTKRSACPVTAGEFLTHAKPLSITIDGNSVLVPTKLFSSGSFGWYLSQKLTVIVDGKPVTVQVGANFVVVGSKESAR